MAIAILDASCEELTEELITTVAHSTGLFAEDLALEIGP